VIDFDALYRAHAGEVFRFSLRLSGERVLAEDITSETFVRAWTARDRVDLATVKGYLLTIARHLYLRGLPRERRREAVEPELVDPAPGPFERSDARAELGAVLADLQTLAEPDRAALLMRAHEQMPYEEIAAALGITVAAAKVKVHRARMKLAERRVSRGSMVR
jgi:RNA polymerase sigma-70 factor (ECF subfamily)